MGGSIQSKLAKNVGLLATEKTIFPRKKRIYNKHKRVYVIANEGFGLGDGKGPAEESKRTKRVQGWSRQIG